MHKKLPHFRNTAMSAIWAASEKTVLIKSCLFFSFLHAFHGWSAIISLRRGFSRRVKLACAHLHEQYESFYTAVLLNLPVKLCWLASVQTEGWREKQNAQLLIHQGLDFLVKPSPKGIYPQYSPLPIPFFFFFKHTGAHTLCIIYKA